MLSTRDTPQNKRTTETGRKGLKKIFQANGQEKKAGVAILTSHKTKFKRKTIKRDKEGPFIILKGRIHQKAINIKTCMHPT